MANKAKEFEAYEIVEGKKTDLPLLPEPVYTYLMLKETSIPELFSRLHSGRILKFSLLLRNIRKV